MQHDFRAVYASLFREWFEVSDQETAELLNGDFPAMNLTTECEIASAVGNVPQSLDNLVVSPNPITTSGQIQFYSDGDWLRIGLYDSLGRRILVISERYFDRGEHSVPIDLSRLSKGSYYVRVESRMGQGAKAVVKM